MIRPLLVALLTTGLVLCPRPVQAQAGAALAGGALGAIGGATLTVGIVVAEAKADQYSKPLSLGWRFLPIPLGVAAGSLLGATNEDRLWTSVVHGTVGFAAGAALGAGVGTLLGSDPESAWAGALIGGASGMLVAAIVGAVTWQREGPALTLFSVAVPVNW
jgi:hypothetical protein